MSLLSNYSTPAERSRGLIWAERFENIEKCSLNGLSSFSAGLSFDIGKGVLLDGSKTVTYSSNAPNVVNSTSMSLVIEFTPLFSPDDGAIHYFINSSGVATLLVLKRDTNALSSYFNINVSWTLAEYQAYWKLNQRNVVVFTHSNGSHKMYLNGNFISTKTTASTPWTSNSSLLAIGGSGSNEYIKSVIIFKDTILTAQEASDYYNNSTFNYDNKARFNLPMTSGVNDVSGKGNNFTLSPTNPVKQLTKGYLFSSGANYITNATDLIGTGDITVSFLIKSMTKSYAECLFSNGTFLVYMGVAGELTTYYVYNNGITGVYSSAGMKEAGDWATIILTRTGTTINLYVNLKLLISTSSAPSPVAGTATFIGSRSVAIDPLASGYIADTRLYPFILTPMQIADLHHKLIAGVNQI